MPVACGVRLGPYEIQSLIGAGGMGEVYRARDTRLDRTVAIKVLPSDLASDPERRQRFEREARTISSLTHPHICTLHDVGEQDGTPFLVMEYLEGESLSDRLAKGRVALAQALEIAIQMAGALAAAHRHGVVHRDLKPGNVMLTKSGVKLLDFGLAKWRGHGEHAVAASLMSVATLSAPLTAQGAIVGTLQYMAPEQIEGREADARTDLFAFGAILYEMITGRRAFEGTSAASLMGAILEREPAPLTTNQLLAPPALDRLVRKCLAKSPEGRWDSAHDVADELRWLADTTIQASAVVKPRASWWMTALLVVLPSLIVGAGVMGLAVRALRPSATAPIVRAELSIEPADDLYSGGFGNPAYVWTRGGSRTALAWTPDGRRLVFVGRRNGLQHLYLRDLDRGEARPLAGTEDAQVPAVSPDGQSVVFWARQELKRVPLDGGPAQTIAKDLPQSPFGVAVGASGRVVFGKSGGEIWQATTTGSTQAAITSPAPREISHVLPQLLANDTVLLFTVRPAEWTWGDERVVAHVLATGERKLLLRDAADARFVPPGHLVFLRRGLLMAVPFDLARLEVTGEPVGVLDGVSQALTSGNANNLTGAGQFSVSSTGTLAYVPGAVVPYPDSVLATVDRQGRVADVPIEARSYAPPLRLSPDGRRLAVSIQDLAENALGVLDLARGSVTKLSANGEATWPRWSPDGQRIAFLWLEHGIPRLAWQRADGSAPPEALVPYRMVPSSWSPDGQHLAAMKDDDIWVVTPGTPQSTVTRFTETPERETAPEFAPDGRWLAYGSNHTGREQVYLRPYPGPGAPIPVSINSGWNPAWNPRGNGELFFLERAPGSRSSSPWSRMMAVNIEAGRPGTPRLLFEFRGEDPSLGCMPIRCYDVAPDGQRFFFAKVLPRAPAPPVTHINLVQNWVEELKAKVTAASAR